MQIAIRSDCLAVIRALYSAIAIFSLSINLYQVWQEIKLLLDKYKIKVTPIKIKVHQDKSKALNELTLLEKINCACDSRVKLLIMNEERKIVPFPFIL